MWYRIRTGKDPLVGGLYEGVSAPRGGEELVVRRCAASKGSEGEEGTVEHVD